MRLNTIITAVGVALPFTATATPIILDSRYDTGLRYAMEAKGRSFIGTALTIRDDASESAIINNAADFNSITPENAQKWESVEPSQGQFNWGPADQHVEYATSRGMQIHCHTLVWHSQLPSWVSNGGFDNATLIEVMTEHITQVVGRYKGSCSRWDVVNEALNEDGTYRDSVFYRTIGEAYIPIAFRIASEVDSDAHLFYNDYNLEYAGPKAEGARRIVELIQSYGVKINGVGLQAHLVSESTPTQETVTPSQETLETALKMFTDRDVDVVYTEIDIRMNDPASEEKLTTQADAYTRVAKSCLAVERCVGMTVWGVSDRYSWIPDTFQGEGHALIWNENYEKKPAYSAFLEGIQG